MLRGASFISSDPMCLLSRNVQGAVNAGRDAVEAGIARPLQRFSEDELFKP